MSSSSVLRAICEGDLNKLRDLVAQNKTLKGKANGNFTALHISAALGQLKILKFVLNNEPGLVRERTEEGCTALHLACSEVSVCEPSTFPVQAVTQSYGGNNNIGPDGCSEGFD